jgi:cell division protein FtsB
LAELAGVEAVNAAYRDRIDALNTDEEIERRARAEYNLVRPDEEAYAVLPPPPADRGITGVWPFAD